MSVTWIETPPVKYFFVVVVSRFKSLHKKTLVLLTLAYKRKIKHNTFGNIVETHL